MGDPVLVRASDLLSGEPGESGGSMDAYEDVEKVRVFRGQGDPYSFAREETQDAAERRAEIDKGNHRG